MGRFIGKVKIGAVWYKPEIWKMSDKGYVGKMPPKRPMNPKSGSKWYGLHKNEVAVKMTAEGVVRQWCKSLQNEGREFNVEQEQGFITVTSTS